MTINPLQFGAHVGSFVGTNMKKRAALGLGETTGIGSAFGTGYGAVTAPSGHRIEGAARGGIRGAGAGLGAYAGGIGGTGIAFAALLNANRRSRLAQALGLAADGVGRAGKRVVNRGTGPSPEALRDFMNHFAMSSLVGGVPGAVIGGTGGSTLAGAALGKPSWETKK